ncbi:acid protease [Microthyrium microscopicum]|uniref:Acid protease n=1 Tax=Microthyrium microscopicum TaxID=703497 RepID=A0A6A6UB88_9PEZI|nr:acid protease [Microthyrium microscopicum]
MPVIRLIHTLLLAFAIPALGAALPSDGAPGDVITLEGLIRVPVVTVDAAEVQNNVTDSGISKRQSTADLDNFGGSFYLITLSLGSNSQSAMVQLDTGSVELWVDPICASSQSPDFCNALPRYDPTTSTTSHNLQTQFGIQYGSGSVQGTYYTDTVASGSASIPGLQFGVATQSDFLSFGILGLGPVIFPAPYEPFIYQLATQNTIASPAFSLDLRSINDPEGSIIFGGLDTMKYKCNLAKAPIIPYYQAPDGVPRFWINFNGVAVTTASGSNAIPLAQPQPVFLDSGATLSYLPAALFNAIGAAFPGATYYSPTGYYIAPCNTVGSLDFTFGNTLVQVPFSEFLLVADNTGQTCILGMQAASGPQYILGDSFLRAAYVVFDLGNSNLWIGQADDCGSNLVAIGSGANSVPQVPGCSCPVSSSSSMTSTASSTLSSSLTTSSGVTSSTSSVTSSFSPIASSNSSIASSTSSIASSTSSIASSTSSVATSSSISSSAAGSSVTSSSSSIASSSSAASNSTVSSSVASSSSSVASPSSSAVSSSSSVATSSSSVAISSSIVATSSSIASGSTVSSSVTSSSSSVASSSSSATSSSFVASSSTVSSSVASSSPSLANSSSAASSSIISSSVVSSSSSVASSSTASSSTASSSTANSSTASSSTASSSTASSSIASSSTASSSTASSTASSSTTSSSATSTASPSTRHPNRVRPNRVRPNRVRSCRVRSTKATSSIKSTGYCGTSKSYCGSGNCNPLFGTCTDPASAPVNVDPTGEGKCGPNNGGFKCSGSQCCSQ